MRDHLIAVFILLVQEFPAKILNKTQQRIHKQFNTQLL